MTFGIEEGVAASHQHAGRRRDLAAQLGAARPGQADVEVLRRERVEADRLGRDDVAVAAAEPGQLDTRPVRGEPLLDADVHAASNAPARAPGCRGRTARR